MNVLPRPPAREHHVTFLIRANSERNLPTYLTIYPLSIHIYPLSIPYIRYEHITYPLLDPSHGSRREVVVVVAVR